MPTSCTDYEFSQIEPYWQSFWEKNKTFRAEDFSEKPACYILDMFPYPSGAGLHVGHPEGYTATDIISRYKKALGFNVLHPMGWDAFGLPAEQHAMETGDHPRLTIQKNSDTYRRQIKRIGFSIDWDREINTTDPRYFKWTQWIFLQLFKHGLAYVDEKPVWWCQALGTVLANEEIVDGLSERGGHPVVRRNLRQWVLCITTFADRLLAGLEGIDWPDSTKRQQRAWIGRSEGAEVTFALKGFPEDKLKIFTTRPDTLFGATYMVLAPEHPLVEKLTLPEHRKEVERYIQQAASKSDLARTDLAKGKSGIFTGSYAINPVNDAEIPIWIADYVLMSYGTGAIMAVPAHDERDHEIAIKFKLPIVEVIEKPEKETEDKKLYTGHGKMVNSGSYTGLDSKIGIRQITEDLEKSNRGKAAINFKLRDWLFSRQRYWGEPFPIVWVEEEAYLRAKNAEDSEVARFLPKEAVSYISDGVTYFALPLPAGQLPLELPETDNFQPSGTGESPLANITEWVEVWFNLTTGETIPATQNKPESGLWTKGRRETNTMPQWAGSCWYHLRYLDPGNEESLIDPEIEKYWGTPDIYIGGAEHAVLHLLYARFWHYFLHDIGVVSDPEPYKKLFHQGLILGEDGEKMSKSRGNAVNPEEVINRYGADSLRLYEMFMGPLQDMKPWNTRGIEGVFRFLKRVWRLFIDREGAVSGHITEFSEESPATERLLHETIKKVTGDIENLRFNTAISQMMIFSNHLKKEGRLTKLTGETFLALLAPFAPHMVEEIWARIGNPSPVSSHPWPQHDPRKFATEKVKLVFQVNGKYRGDASVDKGLNQDEALKTAKEHQRVANHLDGKQVVKVIYVPGKILNIVTN